MEIHQSSKRSLKFKHNRVSLGQSSIDSASHSLSPQFKSHAKTPVFNLSRHASFAPKDEKNYTITSKINRTSPTFLHNIKKKAHNT